MTLARLVNGTATTMHPDHLGSAVAGSNTSGGVAWRELYSPFGIASKLPAANDNRDGFTGHIRDKATGLTYMQARYYDPITSRFLSIDPVDFLATGDPNYFNRYAYTANNPVNAIDPDGRQSTEAIFEIRNQEVAEGRMTVEQRMELEHKEAAMMGAALMTVIPGPADEIAATGVAAAVGKQAAQKASTASNVTKLPKPPTGRGTVPKSQRDPKRAFTSKERAEKRNEQGNKCGNGCGKRIDKVNSEGHHIKRHADGGRSNSKNHAEVCKKCHKELHSKE